MEGVNGRATEDRPMRTSEAQEQQSSSDPKELSSTRPSSGSSSSCGVDPCGDEPGDARPGKGLQNGERTTAENEEESCVVHPCSTEQAVLGKGGGSKLPAIERMENNVPPSAGSSGEGNGNGFSRGDTSIPPPYADIEESSLLKSAVGEGDALFGSTGSEAVQRSSNAQVVEAAPNGLSAADSGGKSQALVSRDIMERPGASAVWIASRDQAKRAGQEKSHSSPKGATAKAGVAVKKESDLAEEISTPRSPSQPGRPWASPESRHDENSVADGALSDSARTSEEAGVPRAQTSGNGTISPARTRAVARTPPHDVSSYSVIATGADSHDGAACQALPGGSVWGSTEHLAPMSGHKRARAEYDRADQTRWGERIEHESLGDTTDTALAAVSYANAVAEGGAVGSLTSGAAAGLQSGGTRGVSPPASNPTAGQSPILTAVQDNITAGPLEEWEGDRMVSSDAAVASATAQPDSGASSNGTVPPKAAEASKATVPTSDTTQALSSNGLRRTTRGQKGSRASNHHDDMMHAMCMICLEKLNDASEGGRAKLLGLLDSCSHRYCYTCILEWSKITNKCPQCKARFHTIKAIKELRRSNDKYRGVAVRVEDRDQRYSFVDVRDVVVLDPEVACHPGCLVRLGVDALQQGWEFSVECEQCSNWYHGLCVGFRQEWEVPDLWFCRSCCGEVYEVITSPDAVPQPTASSILSAMSLVVNNSSLAPTSGQSSESQSQNLVVSSSLGEGRAGEVTRSRGQVPEQDSGNMGVPCTNRTVVDTHPGSGSRSETGELVAELPPPPHTPASPASPARTSIQPAPPSTSPDAEASGRGSDAPYRSPQWTNLPPLERMLSLFGSEQSMPATPPQRPPVPVRANSAPPLSPPVVASSARGRGRPRGSRNKPAAATSPLAHPPSSPQQTTGSPMLPTPPAHVDSAPSPPPTGDAAPAKVRGRPRGSKNKPPVDTPATPALESQPERLGSSASSVETPVPPPQGDGQQNQEDSAQPSTEISLADDEPSRQDIIPQPPQPPAPSFLRSLEASEVNDLCTICGFDTEPDNLIVYCSSCNMGVHQTCYGISEIPTKEWYCSPCSAGVHPSTLACRFCPVKGGALKRCTDDSWGHILCAFWIPECCFLDPQKMEPIGSISRKGQAGGVEKFLPTFRARKCYVCGTSAGSAIRCHASSCKFHLHPMCGSKAGSVYMEIETTMKRGFDGTEHVSVNLVARCPRHSKNKAKGTPGSVYRGSIIGSTADPLSIIDKALEVKDPELGGFALAGKVTWFDPVRSKYCIVASGHSGGGGSGAISSGGGEPKEGCSHWITVDKLVEAKAIGVQKNGKRFELECLPLLEGEEAESGQLDNGVKIERNDEEGDGDKETDVLAAGGEGENKTGTCKREGGASVGLEEAGPNESDAETSAAGKRRRTDTRPPPALPSDVAPTKHAASRPEEQSPPARATPELGSQPPSTVPGEDVETARLVSSRGEGSKLSTEYKVASESQSGEPRSTEIEKRSEATRSPTRLLPSVQIQEQTDAFARYPIRGRRRRPENLTFDPAVQRGLEGVPSAKRPRKGGEEDQSLDVTADAGPDPSGTQLACPEEAAVTCDSVFSLPSGVCGAPQVQPTNATGVVRHQSGSVFDCQPGWPHGMGLLGQVPVMRVRAVRVPGGGDATYFASAYASIAEGVVCDKRSAPSFSFPFEELENMRLTGGATQPQRGTHPDSLIDPPDQSCKLSGGLHGPEGKEGTPDDAETRKTGEAEASRTPLPSKEGQGEKDNEKEKEQGEEVAADQTSNISSNSDDVEEGEIGSLSNGRAGSMPPSLVREDVSVGGGVETLSSAGEQVAKEGTKSNEQNVQPACQNSRMTGEAERATEAEEMEEMDISSDDVSCGGFEGVEPASPCISEDDDDDDDDVGTRWGVFRVGGTPPKISRVDTQSTDPTPDATIAHPVPSPTATETAQVLRGPSSAVESDEDEENSDSCPENVDVSDEVEPEGRESNGFEATAGATSEGSSMQRLEGELSAPEKEPEIAVVQPIEPQQTGVTLALRSIVREQLQGVLRSASKGEEAALAGGDGNDVLERIASDTEDELFRRLYKDITGGREYKAKYKQLLLSLGNVRNYRLVASVLAGNTTPVDLATKDAVGLLNSLSSSLNCLAIPLAGRQRQGYSAGSPAGKGQKGKGKRRGKMMLL